MMGLSKQRRWKYEQIVNRRKENGIGIKKRNEAENGRKKYKKNVRD